MSPFRSPPDVAAFNQRVWELVSQVPPGRVTTYGRLAALIPPPEGVDERTYLAFGPRWVGGAMAHCPDGVPWHRVINAQGRISKRSGGGHQRQREMLTLESVVFDSTGRVDLDSLGWP